MEGRENDVPADATWSGVGCVPRVRAVAVVVHWHVAVLGSVTLGGSATLAGAVPMDVVTFRDFGPHRVWTQQHSASFVTATE